MRSRFAALQHSNVGRFAQKFVDDRGIDLAMLIPWGTLSTIFPVLLGITALAGVLLQDPNARPGRPAVAPEEQAPPVCHTRVVLADEGMDFASANVEVDPGQHGAPKKLLLMASLGAAPRPVPRRTSLHGAPDRSGVSSVDDISYD